ncbi:DUF3560 domain-containing protein [Actinomadura sp. WMMA1423]|uniref:DUF3560 domain-containing protein n=1 Tax=Actinomadura sp. WMMA1423 TaxID=2591108 RepID=UPI0011473DD2|nr:DUF3560 domain-containing protein [Actinomadura sp. WMMA1423]
MTITITHTLAEGTLVHGTARGDGTGQILGGKGGCGFRFSRNLDAWYLPHSRDWVSNTVVIREAERRLREAGYTVTVEVDDASRGRDFAEAEAERNERAEDRAERYGTRGARAARAGAARWAHNRERMSHIPMGQPILVGHHSERRHRNFLDRMWRSDGIAVKDMKRGEYWAARSAAAAKYQDRRESLPTTLRRIAKLEAELRALDRRLADAQERAAVEAEPGGRAERMRGWIRRMLRRTDAPVPDSPAVVRLRTMREQTDGQLAYWREHVERLEEQGAKVWGPGDFTAGDFALHRGRWYEVIRVNPKTLTVPWQHLGIHTAVLTVEAATKAQKTGGRLHTDRFGYDDIQGRMSAEEMAAKLAQPAVAQDG